MSPIAYHLAAVAVMAGVTYLIRALPFAFFRRPIVSRFLRSYSSPTIALTAYNAGPGRVASGEYSTAYAEHVLGHQQTILGWLRSRGCSATFDNGPLVPAEVTEEAGE